MQECKWCMCNVTSLSCSAAAMSATVSRLEGDLARAKAALTDRLATEEIQSRQRRDLEAEVTRLHAEVGHMLSAHS